MLRLTRKLTWHILITFWWLVSTLNHLLAFFLLLWEFLFDLLLLSLLLTFTNANRYTNEYYNNSNDADYKADDDPRLFEVDNVFTCAIFEFVPNGFTLCACIGICARKACFAALFTCDSGWKEIVTLWACACFVICWQYEFGLAFLALILLGTVRTAVHTPCTLIIRIKVMRRLTSQCGLIYLTLECFGLLSNTTELSQVLVTRCLLDKERYPRNSRFIQQFTISYKP